MPLSPAWLWLLLLLLSLPPLVQFLYGRQRRAIGDTQWAAVGLAAMGDGGRWVMVMGGVRCPIGDGWRAAGDGYGSRLCLDNKKVRNDKNRHKNNIPRGSGAQCPRALRRCCCCCCYCRYRCWFSCCMGDSDGRWGIGGGRRWWCG